MLRHTSPALVLVLLAALGLNASAAASESEALLLLGLADEGAACSLAVNRPELAAFVSRPLLVERRHAPNASVQWNPIVQQSARFLAIQHGVRIATQEKTRAELRGNFFKDYWRSVRGLSGWDDGDSWKTNYVGHPMQGSVSGYIFAQNDPRGRLQEFSWSTSYWKSRLRAMAFNAAYSTHYELSPLGEAAIGNVGMRPGTKGAVDLVITPTLGAAWMVTEDLLDAKVIAPLEATIRYPVARLMMRSILNPTRSFANLLRGAYPWHRDTRGGVR